MHPNMLAAALNFHCFAVLILHWCMQCLNSLPGVSLHSLISSCEHETVTSDYYCVVDVFCVAISDYTDFVTLLQLCIVFRLSLSVTVFLWWQ